MGKIAFLFAGQGAQYPGMGESLQSLTSQAAAVFSLADSIRPGTSAQCFTGMKEALAETSNTQPCVYCVDLAAARSLVGAGIHPDGVAGFSLGEMAALAFAGVFSDREGFSLVCKRGQLMEMAAKATPSTMAAVLKLENSLVEEICSHYKKVYPVNYNCNGNLTVAGDAAEMALFAKEIADAKGRVAPLAVAGGFHSPFMAEAAKAFRQELEGASFSAPNIPVYANLTGCPYGENPVDTLSRQMESPVRWQATIERMGADGFTTFIEVGPGKVLSTMMKRILPDAKVYQVEDAHSLADVVVALRA